MAEHLTILEPSEIYDLYSIPAFDKDQQMLFFDLSEVEQKAVQGFKSPLSQLYFILQLGYFKAKQQVHIFDLEEVVSDRDYLRERYFAEHLIPFSGRVSKPTRLAQQKVILQIFDYRLADPNIRDQLMDRAYQLATRHSKPVYIFRELITYAEQHRIVLPAYSTMQRLIEGATSEERKRLERLVSGLLKPNQRKLLDNLLEDQSKGYYLLTWFQQEPPNFNTYPIREQIEKKRLLQPLYHLAKRIIPKLGISNENARYYGMLAVHYTVYKLKQFQGRLVYILLLCFTYYRYREINDTLIEAFKINVRAYEAEAKKAAQEFLYKYYVDVNDQLGKLPKVLQLFMDDSIDSKTPFGIIKDHAFALLEKEKMVLVTDYIEQNNVDEKEIRWQYYQEIQRKITLNLRHLFECMDFQGSITSNNLIKAINKAKDVFKSGNRLQHIPVKNLPQEFIPRHLKKYILKNDPIAASRYEMLLYLTLRNQIEAGDIFITDSFQHQSFDEDLLSADQWSNKERILKNIPIAKLSQPIESLLADWEKLIEEKFKTVNEALRNNQNQAIAIKTKKDGSVKWKLKYEPDPEPYNHRLYEQFHSIGIIHLLQWVDDQTNFLSAFTHILGKRATQKLNKQALMACLLGFATNQGLASMTDRCDLDFYQLNGTSHNFIRQETLRQSNKIIVDAVAELPMFEYYNFQKGAIHSSSDGQKYGTHFETINSRYSAKYFGLSKGVSIYTMVANHIPVNAKVIGANEHESHYVFDLLFNNSSRINPKVHSTDTHGTNHVNFTILDFFGYQFAPRYKQITSEVARLYGFHSPGKYKDYLLRPTHRVNTQLIVDQWDNFQRIIASLALKTTTQSTIIRKLASYKRNNRTQQALWEYDNLVRSWYILNYVDSQMLRKNVQKALNRGESYHRLRRNIAYDNEGKFRVHTVAEQQIWSDCARLIANAIIYYNTYLLSELLEHHQTLGNTEEWELIKKISPIAWTHINIYGTYQFLNVADKIDLRQMVKKVEIQKLLWSN